LRQWRILGLVVIGILISLLILQLFRGVYSNKTVVQFFPLDQRVTFKDVGSKLNIFQKNNNYYIVGDNWSKTSEVVYLRQDVNLLFRNGRLIKVNYPWKEETDWLVDKIDAPLENESIYQLLSYHHAEIHQDELITSQQYVTSDRMYVINFENGWEFFKKPENARQEDEMRKLDHRVYSQRESILLEAIKELNINIDNYEVFNLATFSERNHSNVISDQHWPTVLGGLWEGLYKTYVIRGRGISASMPWVLVDRNGTHLLVIFQNAKGQFEKLIQQI